MTLRPARRYLRNLWAAICGRRPPEDCHRVTIEADVTHAARAIDDLTDKAERLLHILQQLDHVESIRAMTRERN